MAPNRKTAYQNARAAAKPQKGLTYSELLLDNILGLDNDYLSAGEQLGQRINADEIGFLKNAGISAYEGAKRAVTQPLTTAEELLSGLYDSGANVASTLGQDPAYLDNALREMYGVSYDEATDEQVNRAREALFGDVLNVASVIPVGKAAKMAADPVAESIDRANVNNAIDFLRETESTYDPSQFAGMRMYTPDLYEEIGMQHNPKSGEVDYLKRMADADYLESLGYSNEAVSNATGMLDIPMRRVGEDSNYPNLRVAAVPDELFDAYRTRKPKVDVEFFDPKSRLFGLLPPKMVGYASQKYDEDGRLVPGEHVIGISRKADPRLKQNIFDHEMTHVDLREGDILPDAIGGNPEALNLDRIYTLKELTKSLKTASPEEKVKIRAQMKELLETTAKELYYNNPGEMLARLSEGDGGGALSIKRLTAMQALNPYLNRLSLPERLVDAGLTSLLSDTRPYMPAIQRAGNDLARFLDDKLTGGKLGISFAPPGYDVFKSVPMDLNKAVLPPTLGRENNRYAEGGEVVGAPNRMTAYRNARAATPEQKGLTYSELLIDNIIGLDNDYLSAGEQLGQAFNEDEIGFLKNAGLSAYEGAKDVISDPIGAGEELLSGLYNSVSNLATEDLDARLKRMYGVGYDQASEEQVTKAREAVYGDALTASSLIPGAAVAKTGIGTLARGRADNIATRRNVEETLADLSSRGAAQDAALAEYESRPVVQDEFDLSPEEEEAMQADYLRAEAARPPIRELLTREAEGLDLNPYERERVDAYRLSQQTPARAEDYNPREGYATLGAYFENEFPRIAEDAALGRPLTEREAYDVMIYERYGDMGILDPTHDFDSWLQSTGGDTEGARRIAYLTDPTNPQGRAAPMEYDDFYDQLANEGPEQDFDVDIEDLLDYHPDNNNFDAPTRPLEVRPSIGQAAGIAGLYSPTRKAVDLLDRPSYDDLDSLRVQLLNRGAKPEELERLMAKIPGTQKAGQFSKEDLARLADETSQDVVVSTRDVSNSPKDSTYLSGYFLNGAEDIGANVFEVPSGNAPAAAFNHFKASSGGTAPILHTRFGMFRSPGAADPDTYHLGELQSDWAQMRQKLLPTREALKEAEDRYVEADNRLMDLVSRNRQKKNDWEQTYGALSSMGGDPRFSNVPNIYEDAEYQSLEKSLEKAREEVSALADRIDKTRRNGTRDEFDAKHPAPYVGTTSKWVQLGLRQSLLDAVNKGAKRMTISTGELVQGYTGGKLEGQKKFYDDTVQKELEAVLKKFAKEAGIRKPEITISKIVGKNRQEYMVPTVEFTDEFVEALKRVGLPAYAKGGIVSGSSLDVDPFEPALY